MLIPFVLAASLTFQDAKAADAAPANSLADAAKDVNDKTAQEAVAWAHFLGNGCKGAADCFATNEHAEADLLLGGAIETAVKTAVDGLAGKKGKVKLNDAAEGPVTKVGEDGVTVTLNKAEALVTWADVDPKCLAVLVGKAKSTADNDVAAIAMLRLLAGEIGDAKKQSTKLAGDAGKKLGEMVDASKALLPELKSARALESALRDPDAARAIEKLKAAWNDAKATKVGAESKKGLHAQYVLRGEKAFAGQAALNGLVHGKVKVNPAKASPAAGPGGVGLEIEYEFEKDSEGADFDPATMASFLVNMLKRAGQGLTSFVPFKVTQSRLKPTGPGGGMLPIDFAGDFEVEVLTGLNEEVQSGKRLGLLAVGFANLDGDSQVFLNNGTFVETYAGGKAGPTAEKKAFDVVDGKKVEGLHPGSQLNATLSLHGEKLVLDLNGDTTNPIAFSTKKPLRFFIVAFGPPDWYLERLVIRGTATGDSMKELAHVLGEKQAAALFGE
jgi:hypothetical protein